VHFPYTQNNSLAHRHAKQWLFHITLPFIDLPLMTDFLRGGRAAVNYVRSHERQSNSSRDGPLTDKSFSNWKSLKNNCNYLQIVRVDTLSHAMFALYSLETIIR
jgi:hypothetical protein